MEAGKTLFSFSLFPPKTHLRSCPPPPVMMIHEQAVSALTAVPNSVAQHILTSVSLQEQCDEYGSSKHLLKGEKISQVMVSKEISNNDRDEYLKEFKQQLLRWPMVSKEISTNDRDEYLKEFKQQLLQWPSLWYLLPTLQPKEDASLSSTTRSFEINKEDLMDIRPQDLVALASKALSALKQAAFLIRDGELLGVDVNEIKKSSLSDCAPVKKKMVRSKRLLDRQSKKRKASKLKVMDPETTTSSKADMQRKINEEYDHNDPLRLFLWGPETKQLLTLKDEHELIIQIQGLMRLEEVKSSLQSQFDREPTLVEWAEAAGLSCRILQSQLSSGNSSRERLINANLRMVVHVAKQYQGRGLSLQDLLQEGSMGLMRSVEKFKPQAGCRFATYAYWWIRQAIRKAIFQNSRTIRLPEHIYGLLGKISEARKSCIQEGRHNPSEEEVAARAGITTEKLRRLMLYAKTPISMEQPVWTDQATTFQEITADTDIETPDVSVAKQLMRQHVRSLLSVLSPKERQIIRQRFGIADGREKSLTEIGIMLKLSKERIRQLESRALYKLKQCLGMHGLRAYTDLLV